MESLDQVSGAGLLVDSQHIIRDGNDRCSVVFGESLQTFCGEHVETFRERGLCTGQCLDCWQDAIDQVLAGKRQATEQISLEPADSNETFTYRLTVQPYSNTQPSESTREETLVCCSLYSVGTRRGYEETLTALHAATRELMIADSIEEVLQQTAAAAGDVLGFPGTGVRRHDRETGQLRHVAFGSKVTEIESRPPFSVADSPHGRALQQQKTVIDDIGEDDPYDRDVFTQTLYVPIGTEGLLSVGTVGGTFDETDIQFAEVLAENATAAIRVAKTTASLRQERQNLELLREVLTRVLRHNIRNNMSVIESSTEIIDDRTGEQTDDQVDRIQQSVEDVISLSEKARQVSRIIDTPDSRREMDLPRLLDRIVDRKTTEYPELRVETEIERPCQVSAHRGLGLAVGNLLENTPEHAETLPVTARLTTTTTDESVVITVKDDGPGIPHEEIAVLEMESETALQHGSGLGLWIVKWVIEQSDGTLDFETNGGTKVTLTVPLTEKRQES